jgi:dihydrofolate reductase
MYASVSVDGFIADERDQPGPLFDWLLNGDVPLDASGALKVSQASYDYTRPYWDQIGVTIVGRHVFDLTDGWDGRPPGGIAHVVVVTHRGRPDGWHPEAPFHFVDGIRAAMTRAQALAYDRTVEVAAGDVGGQVLAAGLIDEVRDLVRRHGRRVAVLELARPGADRLEIHRHARRARCPA